MVHIYIICVYTVHYYILIATGSGMEVVSRLRHRSGLTRPLLNPLVPDAHYSERQDKPFSLQIQ